MLSFFGLPGGTRGVPIKEDVQAHVLGGLPATAGHPKQKKGASSDPSTSFGRPEPNVIVCL